MTDRVTIKIPRSLYLNLGQMISDSGFSSVNEFIVFVMRTLAAGGGLIGEGKYDLHEVNEIRQRLKKLGYLKD
jgi:hypothetical protein